MVFTPKNSHCPKPQNLTQLLFYLDLLFTRDKINNITTKLYDEHDRFGFHIVNSPLRHAIFHQHQPMVYMLIRYKTEYVSFIACVIKFTEYFYLHVLLGFVKFYSGIWIAILLSFCHLFPVDLFCGCCRMSLI